MQTTQQQGTQDQVLQPSGFTEADLIDADLRYLASQQQREADRVRFLHEQEINTLRARGGL